jgi:hypothetical protein
MKPAAMKVNSALAEQGSWVDSIPDLPGIRIKARGANNSDCRVLRANLIRKIPRAGRLAGLKARPTRTASWARCCSRPC